MPYIIEIPNADRKKRTAWLHSRDMERLYLVWSTTYAKRYKTKKLAEEDLKHFYMTWKAFIREEN